jgi:large conductance mechanosensitive channel
MKLLKEFKAFISRGNVLDLAVGVIIGGAFGKIVSSLVSDIIMPVIGIISGGIDFRSLAVTIKDGQVFSGAVEGGATIAYGLFIQNIIDFLIIALCVFLIIKLMSAFKKKKKEEAPAAPPEPSREEQLLAEIRDLLKDRK